MTPELEREMHEIVDGLKTLFDGKNKQLSLVSMLSCAATTAYMIGMPALEAMEIFARCYEKRVKEAVEG